MWTQKVVENEIERILESDKNQSGRVSSISRKAARDAKITNSVTTVFSTEAKKSFSTLKSREKTGMQLKFKQGKPMTKSRAND